MGLDNGISIKVKAKETASALPSKWKNNWNDDYEICYERKCWGLRNEIVAYLNKRDGNNLDCAEWDLTIKDVSAIRDIYISWLDEERWEEDGRSIWSFDEHVLCLANAISNLRKLEKLMREHNDLIPTYYDSY